MIAKKPIKRIEFNEQDEEFIRKLSKDIGCGYLKANGRTYILNPCDSATPNDTTVFAWVHKEDEDHFWISTRKDWVTKAKMKALADGGNAGITCFPKGDPNEDSLCFDVQNSNKGNYHNIVRALSLINKVRLA